jgi:hypothetical protein
MSPGRLVGNILRGLGSVFDELSRPFDLALAFFVSPLPKRYWRGASGPGMLISGLLQAGLGFAGLVHVYSVYARGVSEDIATATIAAEEAGAVRVSAAPAVAFGALTPLAFFAVSTPAWVVAYVALSGLIRILAYAADHPCGDPVLTFIDDLLWEIGRGCASTVRSVWARVRGSFGPSDE